MHILLTGGAGFIGSHTALALSAAGHRPVIIDNHANSSPLCLDRINNLLPEKNLIHHRADARDAAALDALFSAHEIHAVIHLAGHKSAPDSLAEPLAYYGNNLDSTLALVEAMRRHGCHRLIFSSSATVYGPPEFLPISEDHRLLATNPYGWTKLFQENILRDLAASDARWRIALLRYFNPAGAHPSGLLGEDPLGPPGNLFPCISRFLAGQLPSLTVFGSDYPTPDGSAVRDFLHVMDLAEGHVAALRHIDSLEGAFPVNLGTGTGHSVREVIGMFAEVTGLEIPFQTAARRPGDVASCVAGVRRAEELLHWRARRTLRDMCEDTWNWQRRNPNGYA